MDRGVTARHTSAMPMVIVGVLLLAALLEAGGDALVRSGLQAGGSTRIGLIVLGGVVLTAYGVCVNTPRWDFGRLIGVYIVFFFVVAQAINWFAFHVAPTPAMLVGGGLIALGGLVMTIA